MNLFVAFPSQSKIVLFVSNNDKGLESCSLTSLSLLLNWFNLHDFFFQISSKESINNLLFLNGDWKSEDIYNIFNELILDQSSEFSDWFPLDFLFLSFRSLSPLFVSFTGKSSSFSSFSFRFGSNWCWWCLLSHKSQLIIIMILIY